MDAAKGYCRNIGNDPVKVGFNPMSMDSVGASKIVIIGKLFLLPRALPGKGDPVELNNNH